MLRFAATKIIPAWWIVPDREVRRKNLCALFGWSVFEARRCPIDHRGSALFIAPVFPVLKTVCAAPHISGAVVYPPWGFC